MEEAQIKQIIKRQPLHGSALLDPRCKILLLVCIGFVSYFLAGEVVSLALMLVYGLFIALGNGGKWAVKMIVIYIIVAYLNALLRYVQVPVLSVIMSVFGVTVLKLIPIMMMGLWILRTTYMDDLMVALQRMRLPQAVTIPLVVMFRYIPTLRIEYRQIRSTMDIRGISDTVWKRVSHPLATIEYILIPLLMRCLKVTDELAAYPERDAEHYPERPHTKDETHRLEVHKLGFAYKKGADIFQNVSFEAHAGDVIGILGHNGAGKTTLLSILTGLLKQQRGEVCFDGKKLTPRQRRSLSYLVMQDTDYQLFASSVEEELSLGMKDDCKEKVDETLKALELSDYRERHPASLSGGQKQRVTIGAAIVKGSPVIYFDEPTSGLDYDSMVRVSKLIEQLSNSGVIVFVVSHDFEFIVRTCTEVVQLDDDGAIQNQRLSPEILKTLSEKYFS